MQQKQHQQLMSSLTNISKQINSLFSSRKKVIDANLNQVLSSKPQITQAYNRQIISHCSQYSSIKKFIQDFNHNPTYFRQLSDLSNVFWQTNQKTQRQLERKLKNLKQIDLHIDQLIEKQIQMANQIEQIEELIRSILNKKQTDHIKKAEPLYLKKQDMFSKLQEIKKQKQVIKQQKLQQLNKILQILQNMKLLRKKRIQQCKHTNFSKESINLIQCFMKDVQQIVQNKKTHQVFQSNQKKMILLINQSNQKINKLSKQLTQLFQTQIKTFSQMNQIFKAKSQMSYFSQKMISYFQINQQDLLAMNQSMGKFLQTQTQKNTQLNQIIQGINTTEDTIEIFLNLKRNIETQTLRKRQLVQKINKLNKSHFIEKQRRETISSKQTQIQSLKINFSKLETHLQQAAQEADVKEYKIVHTQLQQLARNIRHQNNQLQKMKYQKRQATKRIYTQTTSIQQQYKDLISEMFPQIWFRDNDFSKQETIADFEVYLGKLFSRLRILA